MIANVSAPGFVNRCGISRSPLPACRAGTYPNHTWLFRGLLYYTLLYLTVSVSSALLIPNNSHHHVQRKNFQITNRYVSTVLNVSRIPQGKSIKMRWKTSHTEFDSLNNGSPYELLVIVLRHTIHDQNCQLMPHHDDIPQGQDWMARVESVIENLNLNIFNLNLTCCDDM